jgi:excisionase family DNA binding protein
MFHRPKSEKVKDCAAESKIPELSAVGDRSSGYRLLSARRDMSPETEAIMANENSALLMTSRDAAKALAVSERTLWGLTQAGELRCVRIGRAVRYDPDDLKEWIKAKKSKGAEIASIRA